MTLQQTLDADETLQDAAQGLLADLETQTDGQGNLLGLSGELVTVTSGAPGTGGTPVPSIQITAQQGSNLNQVELSVGSEVEVQESIVQTAEHVATVTIPSDAGDLPQSAELDVNISGPGFPAIQFEFNIFPGQTPQSIADQLRNEIVNRLGGPGQETVSVEVQTDADTGELSLVLQSSAGAITADIDFESSIQGQSGNLQINTVALPDGG